MAPFKGLFKKKKPVLAVDLGSRTLKGLVLKRAGDRILLDKFFIHDLATSSEQYPLHTQPVPRLQAAIEVHQLQNYMAASSLSHRDILTYEISLPDMPENEIKAALQGNLEEHITFPVEQACFGYVKIGESSEGGASNQVIKPYCVNRAKIRDSMELLKGASLQPFFIEPEALSLTAMLAFNDYLEADKAYSVVDLGENQITIFLVDNFKVQLINTLPIGLGAINKNLQAQLDLSYDVAEKLKLSYSLTDAKEEPSKEDQVIDDVYYEIFYRVQRLMNFFKVHLKGKEIQKVLLTGGGSRHPDLDSAFTEYCGFPAEVTNPFRKIEIFRKGETPDEKLTQLASYMGVAVGLALKEAG